MKRQNFWIPADLLRNPHVKKEYVPSHEREGFDENKVEVIPTGQRVDRKSVSAFVISRK